MPVPHNAHRILFYPSKIHPIFSSHRLLADCPHAVPLHLRRIINRPQILFQYTAEFFFFASAYIQLFQGPRRHQIVAVAFSKYFLLFAGILSGYPIGAKLSGELYQKGVLSYRSAVFFSGFTNNASPMFVIYFVGGSLLHLGNERYVFYLLLLVSSFLGSFCTWFLLRRNPANTHFLPKSAEKKESTDSLSLFDQFDLELNHSAELLIKIGCYILVFSVLTSFLKQTVFFGPLPTSLLCGILEITTGNHLLCQSLADSPIKTALSLAITSFGGLCAMAQTNSVIQKNGLSIFWYAGSKLFSGFFAFFLVRTRLFR